ncbi:MAG: helix-turn-helix transcriptional regulator [Caldilineaceae bacterium]
MIWKLIDKSAKTNLMKRIGEKLQTLRLRRGLTMGQLAEHLDTSHAQISRVESGQRKPSAELVFKISTFFAVPVERLMRDDLELEE